MTPVKEIGECRITVGEQDYFFRPSFMAMTRIGEPVEIVQAFYDLHNNEASALLQRGIDAYGFAPEWLLKFINQPQVIKKAVLAAINVIQACCDEDTSKLTGEIVPGKSGKWAFVYRKGFMSAFEMVLIAQSLIVHGVIGKAKVRQLQKHETGEATTEFRAFDYVSAARHHFSMPRTEAEQLTMTEFQLMLAAKYPDQKGYTREEYDSAADEFFERRKRRLAKTA